MLSQGEPASAATKTDSWVIGPAMKDMICRNDGLHRRPECRGENEISCSCHAIYVQFIGRVVSCTDWTRVVQYASISMIIRDLRFSQVSLWRLNLPRRNGVSICKHLQTFRRRLLFQFSGQSVVKSSPFFLGYSGSEGGKMLWNLDLL